MLLIDEKTVHESPVMDMGYSAALVKKLLEDKKNGKAVPAQEIPMFPEGADGGFYSLPAYLEGPGVAGIKWTTHIRSYGAAASLSSARGSYTKPVIILNDYKYGSPLTLIEGHEISGIRTGAVSAVFFSRIKGLKKGRVLLCGAGHQAVWQAVAVLTVFKDLEKLYIWSRNQEHAKSCLERVEEIIKRESPIEITGDFARAAGESDIVIGATSAETPYLTYDILKETDCYVHIGLNDAEAGAIRSYPSIICDDFECGTSYSAQSLFRLYRADKSIGECVTLLEDVECGIDISKRVMFDSFGLSIFDIGLAWEVYRWALQNGRGMLWDIYGERA